MILFNFLLVIVKRNHCFFVILTTIYHQATITVNHQLSLVIEVDLNQFSIESENDTFLCFNPFFNVYKRSFLLRNWCIGTLLFCGFSSSIQVFFKILHQSNFFGYFSVWATFRNIKSNQHFVLISLISHVINFPKLSKKLLSSVIETHFSWVVEIYSCRSIGKQITQTIFGGIINPFFNENLVWFGNWYSLFCFWSFRLVKEIVWELMYIVCLSVLLWLF